MAILREEKSIARFERVAVVLSGGGALGSYQAGALGAMDAAGFQPNWLAATAVGTLNAVLYAGNPPRQRAERLHLFWRRLAALVAADPPASLLGRALRRVSALRRDARAEAVSADRLAVARDADAGRLRALVGELVDFGRINSGTIRLSLGSIHLPSGVETYFDNDRHIIGIDHVLASAALPAGLPPVVIDGEPYAGGGVGALASLPALLDSAPPADTLCFLIDCLDPAPGGAPGASRGSQQIAAYRRRHDLRRIIGLLGERLPEELRRDPEIRRGLAQGSNATMNLVHLVHETSAVNLAGKVADFSPATAAQRWRAGEQDMAASLARPAWLVPPPRRVGLVVHELRGGTGSRGG